MSHIASYRVQLREGMNFATLEGRLDQIAALGVSHLYLSPILTAAPGSTHGYDVTDPTTVDEELGGRAGFESLSRAAQARGLRVIVDIVPNHMAFGLDTPWLRDVLAKGMRSPHGPVFDIDWGAGPLALPWLQTSLAEMAEAGDVSLSEDCLVAGPLRVPLAPGTATGPDRRLAMEDAVALQERQHWRLLPWQLERDSITHRRFFSVTSLIGVRVEDEEVFDATHAEILDLVERGLIHGLRVDHVDGLVDPGGYLQQLTGRLPDDVPVWVEKILVTGERLPDWTVAGTTGYEASAVIDRLLTDPDGSGRIDALWREETGVEGDFHGEVVAAKREVLTDELAAELRQLRGLAKALADEEARPVGPETLREALTELLVAFPRYRSYIGAGAGETDARIWRDTADQAAAEVRDRATIDWITGRILAADGDAARRLAVRLEQVTGALIAKAHEDTAGFRFNRYLVANEVGADPDRPTTTPGDVQDHLADRLDRFPRALTLGSSHDTKRAEDTRARIAAMSHDTDAATALWQDAASLPGSDAIDANRRFYAFQVALGIWGAPDAGARAADHMVKALREGKEVTYWTAPDETREARMQDWVRALLARWDANRPAPLLGLCRIGEGLALAGLALRLLWPGMPDIYQGGEGPLFQLTDPDNRRPPDWDALARPPKGGFHAAKADLLATGLALRQAEPDLFGKGAAEWDGTTLRRRLGDREARVAIGAQASLDGAFWSWEADCPPGRISLHGPA